MCCWNLAWSILSIILLVCEVSAILQYFEHSLALPFFGIWMKSAIFQSCGHCWVFQICWHTECSTFTASSFRIWNSSTGIPSPPLALFTVMLPKAHLTSHSRMSGSSWVITPWWLSGPLRSFLSSFFFLSLSTVEESEAVSFRGREFDRTGILVLRAVRGQHRSSTLALHGQNHLGFIILIKG